MLLLLKALEDEGLDFNTFVAQIRTKHAGRCRVDLLSYLIMPCQRNMRYPMLVAELLKHTSSLHEDHPVLVGTLTTLKKMTALQNNIDVEELARHHDLR